MPVVADPSAVSGVPESALPAGVELPAASAPAPWRTRVQALVWAHPATPEAHALAGTPARHRRVGLTIAAMIRYLDTPVGRYAEVLASPVVHLPRGLPASSVPFIAVDSLPSVHGGRSNWALPKTLARFAFADGPPRASAGGDGWSVRVEAAARPPRVPWCAALLDLQLPPGGGEWWIPMRVRGLARRARVDVGVEGPQLPSWLRPGTHAGAVVDRARMTFGAPRESG